MKYPQLILPHRSMRADFTTYCTHIIREVMAHIRVKIYNFLFGYLHPMHPIETLK